VFPAARLFNGLLIFIRKQESNAINAEETSFMLRKSLHPVAARALSARTLDRGF
jgi:hypothetical protein